MLKLSGESLLCQQMVNTLLKNVCNGDTDYSQVLTDNCRENEILHTNRLVISYKITITFFNF